MAYRKSIESSAFREIDRVSAGERMHERVIVLVNYADVFGNVRSSGIDEQDPKLQIARRAALIFPLFIWLSVLISIRGLVDWQRHALCIHAREVRPIGANIELITRTQREKKPRGKR